MSSSLKEHNEFVILQASLKGEPAPLDLLTYLVDRNCKHCKLPLESIIVPAIDHYRFGLFTYGGGKGEIKVEHKVKEFFPFLNDNQIRELKENCHTKCRYLKNRTDIVAFNKLKERILRENKQLNDLKKAENPDFVPHNKISSAEAEKLRRAKVHRARLKSPVKYLVKKHFIVNYQGSLNEKLTEAEFLSRVKHQT